MKHVRCVLLVVLVLLLCVGCNEKETGDGVTPTVAPTRAITSIVVDDLVVSATPTSTPTPENSPVPTNTPAPGHGPDLIQSTDVEFAVEEYTDVACTDICDRIVVTYCHNLKDHVSMIYDYTMYKGEDVVYRLWTERSEEDHRFVVWEEFGGEKRILEDTLYQYAWGCMQEWRWSICTESTRYEYTDSGYGKWYEKHARAESYLDEAYEQLVEDEYTQYDTEGNLIYKEWLSYADDGEEVRIRQEYVNNELACALRAQGGIGTLSNAKGETFLQVRGSDGNEFVLGEKELGRSAFIHEPEDAAGMMCDTSVVEFADGRSWTCEQYYRWIPIGDDSDSRNVWTVVDEEGVHTFEKTESVVETTYPAPEGWAEALPSTETPATMEFQVLLGYDEVIVKKYREDGRCYQVDTYDLQGEWARTEWTAVLDGEEVECWRSANDVESIQQFAEKSIGDAIVTMHYEDGLGTTRLNINDCFGEEMIEMYVELPANPECRYDFEEDKHGNVLWQRYYFDSDCYEVQYIYDEQGRCSEINLTKDGERSYQQVRYYPENGDGCYYGAKIYYEDMYCSTFAALPNGEAIDLYLY